MLTVYTLSLGYGKKGKDQPVTNMFCSRDSLELRNEPLFIMASAQPAAYSKSLKYK